MRSESPKTGRINRNAELGTVNPTRVGSTLYQDFLPQLSGSRAARVYEEMSWNDATVGGILYAIEQLVRQVEWTVESDSVEVIDFLNENIKGLEQSWDDFISAALTELSFGWSLFEIVYRLDNGRVYWHKFGFRTQSSLHKWHLNDKGDLEAFEQTMRGGSTVIIPAEKLIHFRTMTGEGRPEGRSWLRRAYRSWYFKKRIEDITAIGVERDLNGIPIAYVPSEVLLAGPGDDAYDTVKDIVTGVKVDEQQGILFPSDVDPDNGAKLFEFDLLAPQGRSKTDSLQYIRALSMDIASVMLAQFIGLGRDAVGSRALAEPQQELFQMALGALLDSIEEQFHRQATERLLAINGMEGGRIVHGELRDVDTEAISQFMLRIAQAGFDWTAEREDPMSVPDELRQMVGLELQDATVVEGE